MAGKGLFDRNTLIIFGFIILLALAVIFLKMCTGKSCKDANFKVTNTEIYAGDLVYFEDNTVGAETWDWNFGDSTEHFTKKDASHIYAKQGEYTVWLTINGCSPAYIKVTVLGKEIPVLDSILPVAGISGPDAARVGEVVKFRDTTSVGTSWEWYFGETGKADATTKDASYVFTVPGPHTVTLLVNGKSNTASHKIDIRPKREPGTGAKKSSVPKMTRELFIKMLEDIIKQKETGAESFKPYFCEIGRASCRERV